MGAEQGASILGGSLIYTLIFLVPGLIAAALFRMLAESKRLNTFDLLTFSLILTLAANIISQSVFGLSLLPDIKTGEDRVLLFSYASFTVGGLILVSACSCSLAVLLVFLTNSGSLYRYASASAISRKSGRINVWHDVFDTYRGSWFKVTFKDGSSITGWPKFYSVEEDRFELFLADAVVLQPLTNLPNADDTNPQQWAELDVAGPGVYIGSMEEILHVTVLGEKCDG